MTEEIKINEFKESYSHFDEKQKGLVEDKHLGLKNIIHLDTKDVMSEYNVDYIKSKDLLLLTIEPEEMRRKLELAKQMGFLEAYREKPSRLRQPVNMIVKRMAECEAKGDSYKGENGETLDFIFNSIAFNNEMSKFNQEPKKEKKNNKEKTKMNVDSLLTSLCEEFNLMDEKNIMDISVHYFMENNLSEKDSMVRIFSQYGIDESKVLDAIQKIEEDDYTRGGRAA